MPGATAASVRLAVTRRAALAVISARTGGRVEGSAGISGGDGRGGDVVDVDFDTEVREGRGEAAGAEVVFGEHAEEIDGGEVEELDWGVDEDADAQGSRLGFLGGGHDGCYVIDWVELGRQFENLDEDDVNIDVGRRRQNRRCK